VLASREYVIPGDVKAVAGACLAHRLVTDDDDPAQAGLIVDSLLEATPAPRP
jgi:hypothetical protein